MSTFDLGRGDSLNDPRMYGSTFKCSFHFTQRDLSGIEFEALAIGFDLSMAGKVGNDISLLGGFTLFSVGRQTNEMKYKVFLGSLKGSNTTLSTNRVKSGWKVAWRLFRPLFACI